MSAGSNQLRHVEGRWEDFITRPDQFAGKRVRITILADAGPSTASFRAELRRWFAETEATEITPPSTPNGAFSDGLAAKFRKQGLVL